MSHTDNQQLPETTGRFVVTYREGAHAEAMTLLNSTAGVNSANVARCSDLDTAAADFDQIASGGGVYFEQLGVAVVNVDPAAVGGMMQAAGEESAILSIEPEGYMYALGGPSQDYLRGFRDAAAAIHDRHSAPTPDTDADEDDGSMTAQVSDTAALTWGLQVTKVANSRYSGRGIKVAVLDTGLDLRHPDFKGRAITAQSFISGVGSVQDGHGHGTHCIGTACGPRNPVRGRRYGIAYGAQIYVGKVLSDQGSGNDMGILAGINWAIANKCQIISMSLGANVPNCSTAYETVGQRALNAGTLIIAAAGNTAQRSRGNYGFVGRPANCRTFMAVGAIDANGRVADFSARDTVRAPGTAVDIAGPGVNVYSSWPMPAYAKIISGTSMATPHVAGIAALWSEKTNERGATLAYRLITSCRGLNLPTVDVGRGLVQAP